jgi:hypothetical protein
MASWHTRIMGSHSALARVEARAHSLDPRAPRAPQELAQLLDAVRRERAFAGHAARASAATLNAVLWLMATVLLARARRVRRGVAARLADAPVLAQDPTAFPLHLR